MARAQAGPALLPMGEVMIAVRVRTRAAWCTASHWPSAPPSETPTTCARSMPCPSSTATVSAAMSASVYGFALKSTQSE
jgi:hypothetical protein